MRHRPRRHLGDAGRGRGANEPCAHGRQWRGVIEEYRDRLDLPAGTPRVTLREGGTPLVPLRVALRPDRRRGLAQGRGRQPDRLVQGPRHDRRAISVAGRGRRGRRLRLDRQHLARRWRPTPPRPGLTAARAGPAGQDRRRQAGAGDRARRPGDHGARQLRRLPRPRPRPGRATTRSRWSTRSTRCGSRARRPRPSRSSTSSATPPTCTCCRSATPATSRPTGSATSEYAELGRRAPRLPVMRGFQAEGAAPLVRGEPVPDPETVATAIRIGNPASWHLAEAAARGVRRRFAARHRRADPRRAARAGPRATASSSSRPPPPASPGCCRASRQGESYAGQHVVVTVTGHGLKDTETALESSPDSSTRSSTPTCDAAAAAAGLA